MLYIGEIPILFLTKICCNIDKELGKVSIMASAEQLSLIKKGVKDWNAWRRKNSLTIVDLSNADLSGLDLAKASLWDANLTGANLARANLTQCDLRGANCQRANCSEANFSESDLRNSNLTQANLFKANLRTANLSGAILSQTTLGDANLQGVNLTAACIYNWLINQNIIWEQIKCNFVYLGPNKSNRYPQRGNLEPGELREIIGQSFTAETEIIAQENSNETPSNSGDLEVINEEGDNYLEITAMTITFLIDEATEHIPESPNRHIKIAARVLNTLQNNPEFLDHFQQIKGNNKLEELAALIPNPATSLILMNLNK